MKVYIDRYQGQEPGKFCVIHDFGDVAGIAFEGTMEECQEYIKATA